MCAWQGEKQGERERVIGGNKETERVIERSKERVLAERNKENHNEME